jgi:hypothetical protein
LIDDAGDHLPERELTLARGAQGCGEAAFDGQSVKQADGANRESLLEGDFLTNLSDFQPRSASSNRRALHTPLCTVANAADNG